jgi:integrative and conjugative element protein (TIGR02256 family)
MYKHAQIGWQQKEAGGQLFSATPENEIVTASIATGPYTSDKRSRHAFNPDPIQATKDRQRLFQQGLHPIGLWHTHPEQTPTPSGRDQQTTVEFLKAFNGEMNGFVLAILGNKGCPLPLTLWLATADNRWLEMREINKKSP